MDDQIKENMKIIVVFLFMAAAVSLAGLVSSYTRGEKNSFITESYALAESGRVISSPNECPSSGKFCGKC